MNTAGTVPLAVLCVICSPASASEDLLTEARLYFAPISTAAPDIQDSEATPEKAKLGTMLFFEPRLSKSSFLSCASCHNLSIGGADNLDKSVGHLWQRAGRNAPTVLNSVFNSSQFWDGRADSLRAQATGPMQADVEMANDPERIIATLKSIPGYVALFEAAFPGDHDPITLENAGEAIEAFEAGLITPNAPFDRFLEGDETALTEQQKRGLAHFIEKNCVECHNGVGLGGTTFRVFGQAEPPPVEVRPEDDLGRFKITNDEADRYMFRVAPLRNVALTAPYFHSGAVWDLSEAVAIMGKAQLGLDLTADEVADITAFLESLTGEQPTVQLPMLPPSTADTPKPAPND